MKLSAISRNHQEHRRVTLPLLLCKAHTLRMLLTTRNRISISMKLPTVATLGYNLVCDRYLCPTYETYDAG